jgi:hypothetical protein
MSKQVKVYEEVKSLTEIPLSERGKVENRRGHQIKPRRYHLTGEKEIRYRERFLASVSNLSEDIRKRSGEVFFNPYRAAGAYFGAVQSLFELGSNEFHQYSVVKAKMESIMSLVIDKKKGKTAWQKFSGKSAKVGAVSAKDVLGRIQHNFRVLQRLGGLNCYGKKLADLGTCIDIKRDASGRWFYMLNTNFDSSRKPLFDLSEYNERIKITNEVLSSSLKEESEVVEVVDTAEV